MQWLEESSKDIFLKYRVMTNGMSVDKTTRRNGMEKSFSGIHSLLSKSWDESGKVKGLKKAVIPFVV